MSVWVAWGELLMFSELQQCFKPFLTPSSNSVHQRTGPVLPTAQHLVLGHFQPCCFSAQLCLWFESQNCLCARTNQTCLAQP